ncbi:hypothetical protein KQI79_03550 [Paenibacillus sp. MSJ-34]|nr:hypothetical protein [Paenibacillus sp. MSJ-34]
MFLSISIIIGLIIALSPVIVTGSWYNTTTVMGNLLVAEFVIRTLAIVIGLSIIYNGVKHYFSYNK